jgi:hypothetical protein
MLRNWWRNCLQRNFSNFWLSNRMAAEELSEEEGEDQSVQQISSSEIKEILKKWTEP